MQNDGKTKRKGGCQSLIFIDSSQRSPLLRLAPRPFSYHLNTLSDACALAEGAVTAVCILGLESSVDNEYGIVCRFIYPVFSALGISNIMYYFIVGKVTIHMYRWICGMGWVLSSWVAILDQFRSGTAHFEGSTNTIVANSWYSMLIEVSYSLLVQVQGS